MVCEGWAVCEVGHFRESHGSLWGWGESHGSLLGLGSPGVSR